MVRGRRTAGGGTDDGLRCTGTRPSGAAFVDRYLRISHQRLMPPGASWWLFCPPRASGGGGAGPAEPPPPHAELRAWTATATAPRAGRNRPPVVAFVERASTFHWSAHRRAALGGVFCPAPSGRSEPSSLAGRSPVVAEPTNSEAHELAPGGEMPVGLLLLVRPKGRPGSIDPDQALAGAAAAADRGRGSCAMMWPRHRSLALLSVIECSAERAVRLLQAVSSDAAVRPSSSALRG